MNTQKELINKCINKCIEREPDLRFMYIDYIMRVIMQGSRGQANPVIVKDMLKTLQE